MVAEGVSGPAEATIGDIAAERAVVQRDGAELWIAPPLAGVRLWRNGQLFRVRLCGFVFGACAVIAPPPTGSGSKPFASVSPETVTGPVSMVTAKIRLHMRATDREETRAPGLQS